MMVLSSRGDKNIQLNSSIILLLSALLLASFIDAKVSNCRPIPECCRKYVFASGCRGVNAKRSTPESIKGNEEFPRYPRMPVDLDYGNENDYRDILSDLPDEDFRRLPRLNNLKNSAGEHEEYIT